MPLVRNHWLIELATPGIWLGMWLLLFANTANLFTDHLPIVLRILVWAGCLAAGLVVVLLWHRFRPQPQVNFDTSEIRRGRRTVPMSEIRWARLLVAETKKSRSITLQFGPGVLRVGSEPVRRGIATYLVRAANGRTPAIERARLVAEVLRRSGIELPKTSDDPTGKFAWFNFPGSITREQAIDVVVNPPAFGDPAPVPSSHMYDPPRPGTTRPRKGK
jgi:hypothetical protein